MMAKTITDALVSCQMAEKLFDGAFNTMRDVAARMQYAESEREGPAKSVQAFLKAVEEDESRWMQYHTDLPEQYEGARYLLTTALAAGVEIAGKTVHEIEMELRTLGQSGAQGRRAS